MNPIRARRLTAILIDCWTNAEQSVQGIVRSKLNDRNEEMLTMLFEGELRDAVNKASDAGEIAAAFRDDLATALPAASWEQLNSISGGLIATVSFHQRHVEGITGGDLGILLIRPQVKHDWGSNILTVGPGKGRGLLCQAKLLGRDGCWGRFTKSQEKVLIHKVDYLALLLYRYADDARSQLTPFQWQAASALNSLTELQQCLADNDFPSLQSSADILSKLSAGQLGTSDPDVIERDIVAGVRQSFIIRVGWPDGTAPPSTIHLNESPHEVVRLQT